MPSSLYPAQKLIDLASNVLLRPLPSLLTLDAAHHQEGRVVRSTGHGQDCTARPRYIFYHFPRIRFYTSTTPNFSLSEATPSYISSHVANFLQNVHLSRPVARPKGSDSSILVISSFVEASWHFITPRAFFLSSERASSSETSNDLLIALWNLGHSQKMRRTFRNFVFLRNGSMSHHV